MRTRTLGATLLVALLIIVGVTAAQSNTSEGVRVVPLADHNALADRVAELEGRVDALEATPTPEPTPEPEPSPTPDPSPEPTPEPTPTPSPTPDPSPTPTQAPGDGFPDASTTGVPDGTDLTTTGSLTITTAGAVIDSRHIRGELLIKAAGVVVKNTRVTGTVRLYDQGATLEMIDSEILDPGGENRGLTNHHITLRRVEIRGFVQSMECNQHCYVYDSLMHKQTIPANSNAHGDGILIDGAANMVFKGNTLACDAQANGYGGGCSAALALYNGPNYSRYMRNTLVEGNLFKAGPAGYCVYAGGPKSDNVDFINNTWERGTSGKCGVYGPVTARATDPASAWTGNRYTDGTPVG